MATFPRNCIFCLHRAASSSEHIWDDWLNRIDGRRISDRYTFTETGPSGELIRQYQRASIDAKWPVVCEPCNNGWMSDITNESKKALEGIIRHSRRVTLIGHGIASLAALACLKAIIVDYGAAHRTKPFFMPSVRQRFMASLQLPAGSAIWIAQFRGSKRISGHVWGNYIQLRSSIYRGYEIYVCTYLVGYLVFQIAVPRWTKPSRRRPPLPPLSDANELWSEASVRVWPGVVRASWPPLAYLDDDSIQVFKDRAARMRVYLKSRRLIFPLEPVTPGQE